MEGPEKYDKGKSYAEKRERKKHVGERGNNHFNTNAVMTKLRHTGE